MSEQEATPELYPSKKKEQRRARTREDYINDVRFLMGTPQGRRVFGDLMTRCETRKTTAVFASANETFFNEGVRSIGLSIQRDVEDAGMDLFTKMLNEARREQP